MSIKTKVLRSVLFCLATSAAAAPIAPLSVVTLSGQQAPGLPIGVTFSAIDFAFGFGYLNNTGQVAFLAFVEGPGITPDNDRGIWVGQPGAGVETIWFGAPGSISRSTSVGDPADGFPPGDTYGDLDLGGVLPPVALNSTGQIVFSGRVLWSGAVLWGGLPLSPHIIARGGFAGPGGGLFTGFGSFVITDSGLAAFQAGLRPGVPGPDLLGIYRSIIGSPVSLEEVAVEGEVAPLGGGAVFIASGGLNGNFIPRMNNANGVAFRSGLAGTGVNATNDTGIWGHNDKGSLSLLAREGAPLPAAGAGVVIGAINPTPPALNGANRIAFRATLVGDGITFGNDDVIIAANALGDLVIAAREGQVVEVAPGEFRTFTSFGNITGPGTQDGSSTSWNDDCRLLFRAEFFGGGVGLDGIGLFIADVNATCRPVVTAGPSSQTITLGAEALFTVSVAEPAGVSYRWHKDEVELTDGPTGSGSVISGAMSPSLHVLGCGAADAGRYNVVVSNLCGITPSSAAMLRLNLGQVTVTSVSGGKVSLSWFGAPNVQLQSATNLTAVIAWADVPDTAGQSSAAVPWAGPQMFFRLASP